MVTLGGRHALGGGVTVRAAVGAAGGALATCGAAGGTAGAKPSATSSLYLENHVQPFQQGRNSGITKVYGLRALCGDKNPSAAGACRST